MNLLEVDVHEVHSSNERLSRYAASTSQGDARLQRHVLKHTRTSTDTSHHLKTSREASLLHHWDFHSVMAQAQVKLD